MSTPICAKSEANFFTRTPIQRTVLSSRRISHRPTGTIEGSTAFEIPIKSSREEYPDFSDAQIYMQASIVAEDGTPMTATDKCAPVNLTLHSAISRIDIELNGKRITSSNPTYPYRAYIESLLSYNSDTLNNQLQGALFFRDRATGSTVNMEDTDPVKESDARSNLGLKERWEFTKEGRRVDMIDRLHCDLANQPKLMLNGVDIKIIIHQSPDQFVLMFPDATPAKKYKFVIHDVAILMRHSQLYPDVALAIENTLRETNATIPLRRVELKTFTISKGQSMESLAHCFLGAQPLRLAVAFVSDQAYAGKSTLNPYNFKHCEMSSITVYINGTPYPGVTLDTDFTNAKGGQSYIRAYNQLFEGTNTFGLNGGPTITRAEFRNGYMILPFDLSPDRNAASSDCRSVQKRGNCRIDVRFETALTESIKVLVYAEFNNEISIDFNRQVATDY